ncbi:FixH family protein [Domibacillus sp. A3M-37]|uniref:FixH family protein n=1 Tax=Domibacillus TaxID=1433999 RepID=UPI00069900F9|nr:MULTISPECIES: FixH family protein [Domibacillus]MCP3761615.1 FixH family protein [Domibacillus sp. A3M-37]
MKKQMVWFMMILVFMLAACTPKEEQAENQPPVPIEAALSLPEKADLNEEVTISTVVTQDGEPVDDADEVKYEIWKEGLKEDSEMLDAVSEGDGFYTVEKMFNEEAAYYVQVHVTARNMHTMPKSAIAIGNAVIPADVKEETTDHDMESMDH